MHIYKTINFFMLNANNNNKSTLIFIGFMSWKYDIIKQYFTEYNCVFIKPIHPTSTEILKTMKEVENLEGFVLWGYRVSYQKIEQICKKRNLKSYFMEDGFIRSVNLGSNYSTPYSMIIDSKGVYYDSTRETYLEKLLNYYYITEDKLEQARKLIIMMRAIGFSKYNNSLPIDIEKIYGKKTKKRVLVIGQVEDDASITYGLEQKIYLNDLVRLAKAENPDSEIIYKIHPDVIATRRINESDPNDVADIAKIVNFNARPCDALQTIDHVYTLTSLMGLEALIHQVPKVTCIGMPFYAGFGLTDDRQQNTRRKRKLTLEELVAICYIEFPHYKNKKGETCSVFEIVDILQKEIIETML